MKSCTKTPMNVVHMYICTLLRDNNYVYQSTSDKAECFIYDYVDRLTLSPAAITGVLLCLASSGRGESG